MRTKIILLVISLIAILIVNSELEKNGAGYKIFKPTLPPTKLSIDYNVYDGYSFEEEGFIKIIQENHKIKNILIKNIAAYAVKRDTLFIKAAQPEDKILAVTYNKNRNWGDKYVFTWLPKHEAGENNWYSLKNYEIFDRIFILIHFVIILLILLILNDKIARSKRYLNK